jgi:hypothetical protein
MNDYATYYFISVWEDLFGRAIVNHPACAEGRIAFRADQQADGKIPRWTEVLIRPQFRLPKVGGRCYVADFAFWNTRSPKCLLVEIDGPQHIEAEQAGYDKVRDKLLASIGYPTQRFTGEEVLRSPRACLDKAFHRIGWDPA